MILAGGKGDAAGSIQLMAIAVWRCWAPSGHFINVRVFHSLSPCPHHSFLPGLLFSVCLLSRFSQV